MKTKKGISVSDMAPEVGEQAQFETVDAAMVAALLGKTPRQINNYINLKGLPCEGEGRRRTFNWLRVLEWWVDYRISLLHGDGNSGNEPTDLEGETSDSRPGKKEDIRQANLRKTRAEADLKELALARQNGEVIVIADAKVRLDRMMGNLRAKLLALGPKLADRLEGEKTRTGKEAVLKEELETLCREISTGAVVDLPAEPVNVHGLYLLESTPEADPESDDADVE